MRNQHLKNSQLCLSKSTLLDLSVIVLTVTGIFKECFKSFAAATQMDEISRQSCHRSDSTRQRRKNTAKQLYAGKSCQCASCSVGHFFAANSSVLYHFDEDYDLIMFSTKILNFASKLALEEIDAKKLVPQRNFREEIDLQRKFRESVRGKQSNNRQQRYAYYRFQTTKPT